MLFNKLENKKNGGRMSRKACAKSCCNTEGCTHWQELPDRGCFHNDNTTRRKLVHCETYQGTFLGGRKCVKDFCGGKDPISSDLFWKPPFRSNWG